MAVTDIGDPRLQALFGASDPREAGVRPTVRLPRKGLPPAAIAFGALVLAVLLFTILNARRTVQAEPSVIARPADGAVTAWQTPPPLYIPPVPQPAIVTAAPEQPRPAAPTMAVVASQPRSVPAQIVYEPQPLPEMIAHPPAPPPHVPSGAALVIDTGGTAGGQNGAAGLSPITAPGQPVMRMRASALANRAMTVPQGYVIPAVLETGFDSTRPGFARAVVSRDVRGFDGRNILIPRGSRLIGEYRSDTAQGQNRAVIVWTRLIRPDGMTIAMDSPAVDTVGRGGIPASVNTHFIGRLGDALLQTTMEVGSLFAGRAVTGPVVVLPGNGSAIASQLVQPRSYVPTLTVAPGKSISVFVAHDLDFSAAGSTR